jgi:hypothetical protein
MIRQIATANSVLSIEPISFPNPVPINPENRRPGLYRLVLLFLRAFTGNMPYYTGVTRLKRKEGGIMQNFLRIRVAIDSLIDETKLSIQQKSVADSMEQIERARELVQKLQQLSTSDQEAIVAKRKATIEALAENAGKLKAPPRKKGDLKGKLVLPLATP